MAILKYDIGFIEQAMDVHMLYPSEPEIVQGFIRGLAFLLYLALKNLVATSFSFSQVVDHTRVTKKSLIEVAVNNHVINIVILEFYLGVGILMVEFSFSCSLSVLCRQCFLLEIVLRLVVVIQEGKVLIGPLGALVIDLQAMVVALDQQVQYLRVC